MRGAQFSATLNKEKRSDLHEEQASTSVPRPGGFALMPAMLSCTAHTEEITCGAPKPPGLLLSLLGDALRFPPWKLLELDKLGRGP